MAHHKVLVIDYEPKSIESTSRPLRAAGFQVEVAQDGQAGLDAFHRIKPDLVLVEAMLPKKHGFDVCQEIKGSDDGKDTPVLITTGVYRGRKYRDQAVANFGCDEYLEKPIDEAELVRVCRRFVADVEADSSAVVDAAPLDLADLEALSEDEISDRLDDLLADFGKAVDEVTEETTEPENVAVAASAGSDPALVEEPAREELDALLDGAVSPPVEVEPLTPSAPFETPVEETVEATVADDESVEGVEIDTIPDLEEPAGLPVVEVPEAFDLDAELGAVDTEVVASGAETAQVAPVGSPDRPARSKRGALIAAAAIVIAAAGIAGWYFTRGGEVSTPQPVTQQIAPKPVVPAQVDPVPATPAETAETAPPQDPEAVTPAPVQPKSTPPPARAKATSPAPERRQAPAARDKAQEPVVAKTAPVQSAPADPAPARTEPAVAESAANSPDPAAAAAITGTAAGAAVAPDAEPTPMVGVRNEPPAADRTDVITRQEVTSTPEPTPPPEPVVRVKAGALVPLIEVDRQPVAKRKVQPKYHAIARQLRQEGSVVVRILVDEIGKVQETELVRGIPNSSLNDSAAHAIRKWTYEPAMKDGVPVKVWTTETVHFRL